MSENLMIAHREWATRPPDQRFQSLDALQSAVEGRRRLSHEVGVATKALRLIAGSNDDIEIDQTGARLTNWSFGQAASLGASPAGFLRELPAPMAADVLNHRLQNADRDSLQVLVGADADGRGASIRAFTSDRYGRIWDSDVIRILGGLPGPPCFVHRQRAPTDCRRLANQVFRGTFPCSLRAV